MIMTGHLIILLNLEKCSARRDDVAGDETPAFCVIENARFVMFFVLYN